MEPQQEESKQNIRVAMGDDQFMYLHDPSEVTDGSYTFGYDLHDQSR